MEIKQEVIDTVCNSLRASRYSLQNQLRNAQEGSNKKEIITYQLADVEEALSVFQNLES
jgi:hypothetical protein